MQTTISLDDALLQEAIDYTGIQAQEELIQKALVALMEREAARRLAAAGGSEPDLKRIRRRRLA